jgi:hypothetical protein
MKVSTAPDEVDSDVMVGAVADSSSTSLGLTLDPRVAQYHETAHATTLAVTRT